MLSLLAVLSILQAGSAPATCVPAPAQTIARPASLEWFRDGTATVRGRRYSKYGLPRVLGPGEVEYFTAYLGGYFYIESGTTGGEILYLLTDLATCEFQPYQELPRPSK